MISISKQLYLYTAYSKFKQNNIWLSFFGRLKNNMWLKE